MVVGSERSDTGRQRTLRDLLSIGGIVGCVALGVAVLVAPAAENLRSIVPDGAPITAPEVTPRLGDVAVEVRPGATTQRRASITSLSPTELVLAPFEIAGQTAVLATTRSLDTASLLASTADGTVIDGATTLPEPLAPAAPVVAPVTIGVELSAQSSAVTSPGKGKGLVKAPGALKRKTPGQVSASSSGSWMHAASSTVTSSEDDGTRGRGPKADTGRPRDQHPGRAPEHAAVHQRR